MVVLVHVLIALLSVGCATYAFLSPSKMKLRVNYLLVAMTLASGTYLLMLKPSHMVQSCMMGLVYIGFVTFTIVAARRKLAKETGR